MKAVPESPADLVAALAAIFPAFSVQRDPEDEDELTYHSVFLFYFNPFFGKHAHEFTRKQLTAFSQLLARSLAASGSLSNAVDTCFLEHTGQMNVRQQLGPYLKEALREAKT
jgi:hypothetical protein